MTDLQQCSRCKCKKLLELFKVRKNTGKILKTCIQCCDRYKCDQCDGKFSSSCSLQTHIKRIHYKIKDFECSKCKYKCSTKGDLQKHIKQVHDQIKDYECNLCEYKCCTNVSLQSHIKICKGKDASNMSGLELRTKEALEQLGFFKDEDYIFNCTYSKLTDFCGKNLKPDFRFFKHKIIIEIDGSQHFKPKTFGSSREEAEEQFLKTQEHDQIKNNFCRIYGYKMIRIKYTEIINTLKILHSELDDIIEY